MPVLLFYRHLGLVLLFPFLSFTASRHSEHSMLPERYWQAILSSSGSGSQ